MKIKIFAVSDQSNRRKLIANGATVLDVIPQGDDTSAYVVDVADTNVDNLIKALFGISAEEAKDNGILEMNANIEKEQKMSKQAQEQAIDDALGMVKEGEQIVEATVWDAADDFVADAESDIEVVDTHNGKMLLSDGYVLGFLHLEEAEPSVADLFDNNEKLAETTKTALLTEASVAEALASFGFEPYTVELDSNEAIELAAKARLSAAKLEFGSRVESLKSSVEQAIAMAILAVTKGMEAPCPLKASLIDALDDTGAENSEEFVEETVANAIPEFVKKVCAKTYEFLTKPDQVRDEIAKTIELAAYAKADRTFSHKVTDETKGNR